MNILNVIKNIFYNIFRDKRINSSETVYNYSDLLGYIKRTNLEIKEINSDTFLENIAFISIESNNYKVYDNVVGENIDAFAAIYKNDEAIEFVFYNSNNLQYIKLLDDRGYGQYYKGAEFTEGNLEINFPKIVDSSINKIEVGLGIYENNNQSSLSLSNKHISDVVITVRHDNAIYYSIKENSIMSESKFCVFLSFIRKDNKWYLSTKQKDYKSVAEFYKINFTTTFPNSN